MKKLSLLLLLLIATVASAQKPLKAKASLKSTTSYDVSLKEFTISSPPVTLSKMATPGGSDSIYYTIPVKVNGAVKNITLVLGKKENTTEVKYSSGAPYVSDGSIDYQGTVQGKPHSMVSVTILRDAINGIAIFDSASYDIAKIPQGTLVYKTSQLIKPNTFKCDDLSLPDSIIRLREMMKFQMKSSLAQVSSVNCVQLAWVIKYEIYQQKLGATASFIQGLFNQVQMLYAYDSIQVKLKTLVIFNQPDPFTGVSTMDFLNSFQAWLQSNALDGDARMLIGTGGGGGIAYVDALCTGLYNIGYAGITFNYATIPTYSWPVEVITHEQGHIFGSQHTHACVWNGNGTAIDNCGPTAGYGYEGTCCCAATPLNGGTIMSYCHLLQIQINFALGFGPQPRARIQDRVQHKTCLTPCDSTYNPPPVDSTCHAPLSPATWNITSSSAKLQVAGYPGAVNVLNFQFEYHKDGDTAWIQKPKTVLLYSNITGLLPTTKYWWRCKAYCTLKNSVYTQDVSFTTTAPVVCNTPAGLAASGKTQVSVTLSWVPSGTSIYNVRWRVVGTTTYTQKQVSSNATTVSGLTPATAYNASVQGQCPTIGSAWSPEITFSTLGVVDTCLGKPSPVAKISYCYNTDSTYTFESHAPANVTYQWRKNGGAIIATTQNLNSVVGLVHGDEISLTVTYTDVCQKAATVKIIL